MIGPIDFKRDRPDSVFMQLGALVSQKCPAQRWKIKKKKDPVMS
jgi:hypothetical protein